MSNILTKQEYVRLELVKVFGDSQSEQWIDNMVGFVLRGSPITCNQSQSTKSTPANSVTPLTDKQLKEIDWWCGNVTDECKVALNLKGIPPLVCSTWKEEDGYDFCAKTNHSEVGRSTDEYSDICKQGKVQIHFIGGEFYL